MLAYPLFGRKKVQERLERLHNGSEAGLFQMICDPTECGGESRVFITHSVHVAGLSFKRELGNCPVLLGSFSEPTVNVI